MLRWLLKRKLALPFLLGILLTITLYVSATRQKSIQSVGAVAASSPTTLFMPIAGEGSPPLLCRFGVNVLQDLTGLNLAPLRIGWYVDYDAQASPLVPKGIEYTPVIRLTQTGANASDYTYSPGGAQLQTAIASNPGADWLVGNEPDRRDYQDDIEPHVYAAAYHELYHLIKNADPTARIFAGTIVQPTPIRLQYLDMVLESYESSYGEPMPADGWSIHNFILNEVSCEYDETNCWGAEIPPGIDAPYGEIIAIDDNDNIDIFKQRIRDFRQWMADRGYGGLPVLLSEYGVLMPEWLGFPVTRVNTFMNNTFNYMLSATDSQLGDPNDGYRLIQKWAWYSTGAPDDLYNGALFDAVTKQRTAMGDNYAAYTAQRQAEIDLYPSRVFSTGSGSAVTLKATIANSGNLVLSTTPVTVQFFRGDPAAGGVQIGADQTVSLSGCGDNQTVEVVWRNPPTGNHTVYVVVDPGNAVSETNEQNNKASQQIVIGGN
ncbi:MAG TPA: CARDB domain-containing protein [Anaerolineae bacterium]